MMLPGWRVSKSCASWGSGAFGVSWASGASRASGGY